MDSVHLGQAAHTPPVYRMIPPYNFEKLHLPHLLTPVPVRLEAAAGYRLPGCEGGATSEDQNALRWGQFRGSFLPTRHTRVVLTRVATHTDSDQQIEETAAECYLRRKVKHQSSPPLQCRIPYQRTGDAPRRSAEHS